MGLPWLGFTQLGLFDAASGKRSSIQNVKGPITMKTLNKALALANIESRPLYLSLSFPPPDISCIGVSR